MFEIKNNQLLQDGVDISDKVTIAQLEADGKTLLTYAKFKAGVDKLSAQCFGEQKKRKAPAKPKATEKPSKPPVAATPPVVPEVKSAPVTLTPAASENDPYASIPGIGTVDTRTGEVF